MGASFLKVVIEESLGGDGVLWPFKSHRGLIFSTIPAEQGFPWSTSSSSMRWEGMQEAVGFEPSPVWHTGGLGEGGEPAVNLIYGRGAGV